MSAITPPNWCRFIPIAKRGIVGDGNDDDYER